MLSKTSMTHPVILWSAVVLSVSGTVPNGEKRPLAAIDEAGTWFDLGAGCCSDRVGHLLFKNDVDGNLDGCKKKCLEYGTRCKFIEYGWKDSKWCTVVSASCTTLNKGPSDCGSSGNTGVHSYEYKQDSTTTTTTTTNGWVLLADTAKQQKGCRANQQVSHSRSQTAAGCQNACFAKKLYFAQHHLSKHCGCYSECDLVRDANDYGSDAKVYKYETDYELLHEGHCGSGFVGATTQATITGCLNQCKSRPNVDYFAYRSNNGGCSCYSYPADEKDKCPKTNMNNGYTAYRIVSQATTPVTTTTPTPIVEVFGEVRGNNVYHQIAYETGTLLCEYKLSSSGWRSFSTDAKYYNGYAECPPFSKGYPQFTIRMTLNGKTYLTNETYAIQKGRIQDSDLTTTTTTTTIACMDANVLAMCIKWGGYSKEKNGCNAFANGWKKGNYQCHGCGKVSRTYPACSLNECNLLCEDLYDEESHRKACKSGCNKYSELIPACSGGDWSNIANCCKPTSPCDEGHGDCETDADCKGRLVCGDLNCDSSKFSVVADCCTQPKGSCIDADNGLTDRDGNGCSYYDQFPYHCDFKDDFDFIAADLCCSCGRGRAIVTYDGLCRYGDNRTSVIASSDESSLTKCKDNCLYRDNRECVAYSYESPTDPDYYNCNTYKAGPYTFGSGESNIKCYIRRQA